MTTEQSIDAFVSGFKFIREIKHDNTNFIYPRWSPNGNILALGPDAGSYALWNKETSAMEFRRTEMAGPINLAWSPDGQDLAIACEMAGIIQIQSLAHPIIRWDEWNNWTTNINTFSAYGDPAMDRGVIKDIKWLPNGRNLITAHKSHEVIMWDVGTAEILQKFKAFPGLTLINIAIAPDGKYLTTNDEDMLRIRDANNFEHIVAEIKGDWSVANHIDWSPNGRFIAVGAFHGSVYILDTQSWKWIHKFDEPKGQIHELKFSPTGDFLAAIAEDNIFRLWNCKDWQQKIQVPDLSDGFNQLSFHPNEAVIAISAKGKIKLWEYDPFLLG